MYDYERREELSRLSLADLTEVAMHMDRADFPAQFPDKTPDQLILKLAFMREDAKIRRTNDGWLIVESVLGAHYFILDHTGTRLVLEQVL